MSKKKQSQSEIILDELGKIAADEETQWFVSALPKDAKESLYYTDGTMGFLLDAIVYLCNAVFENITKVNEYVIIKDEMDKVMTTLRKWGRKHSKEVKQWKENQESGEK